MSALVWDTEEQKAINAKWRREKIAIAAMQGILSSESSRLPYLYEDIASDAVNMADALIAVLDRDK